jgi:hypothetical protein
MAYALTSANDHCARDPKDWVLQGSVDGDTWVTLDQRAGETFSERFLVREFTVANATAYSRYRLYVTGNDGAVGEVQLNRVQLLVKNDDRFSALGEFFGVLRSDGPAVGYRGKGVVDHELDFRTSGVVPGAAQLGGSLPGGVQAPARSPSATPAARPEEPPLVVEGYDGMNPLVVRTDFTDEDAWGRVVRELRVPVYDNPVEPCLISDPRYAGAPTGRVLQDVRTALPEPDLPEAVFIADSTTMHGTGHPLLAVSTEWDGEPCEEDEEDFVMQFRLLPNAAVVISINLGLGNMDFEDFAGDGRLYERMV